MKSNEFDSYLKHTFENLEIEPPINNWERINTTLNNKNRHKHILFTSIGGCAASIIILFSIYHLITSNNNLKNKEQIVFNSLIKQQGFDAFVYVPKSLSERINFSKERRTYIDSLESYNSIKCIAIANIESVKKIDIADERTIIEENISSIKKEERKLEIAVNASSGNTTNHNINTEQQSFMVRRSIHSPVLYTNNVLIPKYKSTLHTNINIRVSYPISNKFSIVSGLGYLGFKNSMENYYFSGNLNDFFNSNFDIININNVTIKDIQQDFAYMEIPILLKYSVINKRISIYLNGGIGLNYLIKNSSKLYFSNGESIKSSSKDIKTFNSCGLVSIGASTPIYRSLSINVEGQYRSFFSKISSNNVFQTKQSIPSVSFGLSYKL